MPSFDVDAQLKNTPLHSAAWGGNTQQVQQLLRAGASINASNTWGQTPLHLVAKPYPHSPPTEDQQIEVARMLLEVGADVNAKDEHQGTPLHLAALFGQEAVVKLLLEGGAEVDAHTDNGWTPLHSAVVGGHQAVAEILLKNGGNINDAQAEESRYGRSAKNDVSTESSMGKYTPLGLVLNHLQATTDWDVQEVREELRKEGNSDEKLVSDMEEWRLRDIHRLQAMVNWLQQRGAI
jgi:hypothetical protein